MESDWISSQKQAHSKYKFYDYAPRAFQKIRRLRGIKEDQYIKQLGPEQILNSLLTNSSETMYQQGSSGRSGGLFFYTKDKRFMMKTLSKREFFKLRSSLKDYVHHLQNNPDSLVIKFFGMY